MGLRIRLVEPRPAGHNVYDRSLLPRLGLPLMAKMLAESGHDVRIYCEILAPVDLQDLLGANLVGISSTTATAPAAYRLADLLGTAGVPVVLGGPHVSFCADEALGHAHYVVRGEGEQTICELVACLEEGRPLEEVRGLSFRAGDGESHHNPARPARPSCCAPWLLRTSRRYGPRKSVPMPPGARSLARRSTMSFSPSCASRAARW